MFNIFQYVTFSALLYNCLLRLSHSSEWLLLHVTKSRIEEVDPRLFLNNFENFLYMWFGTVEKIIGGNIATIYFLLHGVWTGTLHRMAYLLKLYSFYDRHCYCCQISPSSYVLSLFKVDAGKNHYNHIIE